MGRALAPRCAVPSRSTCGATICPDPAPARAHLRRQRNWPTVRSNDERRSQADLGREGNRRRCEKGAWTIRSVVLGRFTWKVRGNRGPIQTVLLLEFIESICVEGGFHLRFADRATNFSGLVRVAQPSLPSHGFQAALAVPSGHVPCAGKWRHARIERGTHQSATSRLNLERVLERSCVWAKLRRLPR